MTRRCASLCARRPAGLGAAHISAYAASHPWEDWAETFAHYLHITDTLEMVALNLPLGAAGYRRRRRTCPTATAGPAGRYRAGPQWEAGFEPLRQDPGALACAF